MASKDKNNLVDINSNTQMIKLFNKKGRAHRILCLVFSILFLLGGAGMIYYYSLLDTVNYVADDKANTKVTIPDDATDTDGNKIIGDSQLLQDSKVLNIMLFGEDNNQGDKYGRTDTMILLSIDSTHKKLKMTSFQRDTYVYIPGNGYNKINASYTLGGAALSIQTIEANFGIKIDRYAVVDFKSFIDIIDTLGGVEIEVTEDEIAYINYQMYKNGQSHGNYTTITDAPGIVKLTGQEALWYARNRGLTKGEDGNEIGLDGDDWDRTSRQRKLLEKMVTDLKGADLGQIISIVNSIGPKITTNLKKDEITALVSHALTYINYKVEQNYVPKEGLWYYDNNTDAGSVIAIADMEAQRRALAEFIYEEKIASTTSDTETE